jgi:DNA-binding response OmpR family regulator
MTRVLVVEDDTFVGELCCRVLETEGYSCALAHTVEAARKAIADCAIDLLLADVVLSGGSTGRDLADEMKTAKIPVIYMSGEYHALRELGMTGVAHLQKPFRIAELLASVRNALPPGSPIIIDA